MWWRMTSLLAAKKQGMAAPQVSDSRAARTYKTAPSRISRRLEHLLCQRPALRGRVPLRSTSFPLRQPWTSRGGKIARSDCPACRRHSQANSASRGTNGARSDNLRQPLEDKEAQNNSAANSFCSSALFEAFPQPDRLTSKRLVGSGLLHRQGRLSGPPHPESPVLT
ncbi:hypothetical protein EJ02DRAFT_32481 [Clathrospora elynae]|uniref:Uncharacterized protein n=1 Tax=Clathrospora elynae TaxID=706981 RepID=A0A6A5SFC4_9PLEO|nr:hypothetical protein EJ02DRAFT_32481 [Clathrospora elynae]